MGSCCVVLAGTSERLVGLKVLEGVHVGVVAPSDLARSLWWKSFIVLKART